MTQAPQEHIQVVEHPAERYYELQVDGSFAGLLVYELSGTRRVFTHTFIEAGYRGRGLATKLIRDVLDDVRAKHATITNFCPVVDRFITSNPEYEVVIDPAHPGSWPRNKP